MPLTVLNVGYPLAPVSRGTAGGAEQILALLDEALVKAGHHSIVIAPSGSKVLGTLLATATAEPPLTTQRVAVAWEQQRRMIRKALSEFPVDVIHMHGIDFHRYLPQCAVPVLVTLHLPPSWYPAEVYDRSNSNLHLVCVSRSQARRCPRQTEIYATVENGVRLADFRSAPKKDYVVALGRICPEKAFHLAIDAATQAGLSLILAGEVFGYSAHQQYWEREIKPRLKAPHRFIGVVGPQQKRELLAAARCLVVPSLVEETSSLVAMEAMASGTPVVALRRGALVEVVEHGRTGFLVEKPEELPAAISATEQLSSEACRERAEKLFSSERMTDRYLSLYWQLASQQSLHRIVESSSMERAA
ncbi:MAG TPA: glycosyltransferase family 4 protein [Terriglobales bacterium]|nr:glycosyltransferase family 4 protein [Terriglobales bacterium]